MTWTISRESEFSAPRDDCPHPEWWTSENHAATERELSLLVGAFVRAWQPEFVLEIGAHYGQTTELIGMALKDNGHGRCVSLDIEIWAVNMSKERCASVLDVVDVILIDSMQYVPPEPIDLLFVDGQMNRVLDLEYYLPYCSPGAVVILHDMAHRDYKHMLPRVYELLGDQHIMLNTPRGMVIGKLPDERFTF